MLRNLQTTQCRFLHTLHKLLGTPFQQCTNGGGQQDVELDMDTLVESLITTQGMLNKANERFASIDVEMKRLRDERTKLSEEVEKLKRSA